MSHQPTCPRCRKPLRGMLADCPDPECVAAANTAELAHERAEEHQ